MDILVLVLAFPAVFRLGYCAVFRGAAARRFRAGRRRCAVALIERWLSLAGGAA